MSVIATVEVPAREFTLGAALGSDGGIRVRVERVVPLGNTFIPYFWASDDSVDHIEQRLSGEADIDSFRVVDRVDGEALVRVEWAENVDGLLDAVADADGSIIEAVGEGDTWRLQLRFPDHDDLTAFYRRCGEEGIRLDLRRVHNPGPPAKVGLGIDLSEPQREALVAALEEGYFDVPRGTNLVDLSERLGVSDTATSQRLRRGLERLLRATIDESDEGTRAEADRAAASGRDRATVHDRRSDGKGGTDHGAPDDAPGD